MTQRICLALSLACVVSAGGCASHKKDEKKVQMDRGVTDIAPKGARPASSVPPDPSFVSAPASASQPKFVPVDAPAAIPAADSTATVSAAPAPAAAVSPAPVVAAPASPAPAPAPAVTQVPAPASPQAASPAASPAPAGASRQYKVQKGDTLFGIARTHYGDGKRWQQIASANAGLTPGTLKAGSTIVVP